MTTAVLYHRPAVSSLGERFEATMTNRQVEIGFGSKRLHFTMRSSRLRRSARSTGKGQSGSMLWRAMGYVGCASVGLGLVFVSGSILRAAPPVEPYAVVMPIDANAAAIMPRHKAKPRVPARAKALVTPLTPMAGDTPTGWSVAPASDVSDATSDLARPSPDVATLPTVNGERAVAVYGPSRIVGGRSCRDVNVFVRDIEGKVSASPTTECKAR